MSWRFLISELDQLSRDLLSTYRGGRAGIFAKLLIKTAEIVVTRVEGYIDDLAAKRKSESSLCDTKRVKVPAWAHAVILFKLTRQVFVRDTQPACDTSYRRIDEIILIDQLFGADRYRGWLSIYHDRTAIRRGMKQRDCLPGRPESIFALGLKNKRIRRKFPKAFLASNTHYPAFEVPNETANECEGRIEYAKPPTERSDLVAVAIEEVVAASYVDDLHQPAAPENKIADALAGNFHPVAYCISAVIENLHAFTEL